jgi:hypothetical protein
MATSRRGQIADDQYKGDTREPQRGSPPGKPGRARKRVNKGGRATAENARGGRAGVAKKTASSSKGTDRSRHKTRSRKKTRATSRSPSVGRRGVAR